MLPIIVVPDWNLSLELMCDASDFTVSDVLSQHQNKVFHTIYYASKKLNEDHLNYTTTIKESLVVCLSIR